MKQILEIFKKYKSFALFCHINPDADALGTMNALALALRKLKKKVYIYCDTKKVPTNVKFLNVQLKDKVRQIEKVDVCVMLDCNSLERIGKYGQYFDKAKIKVNIDHHQKSDYQFDYSLVEEDGPSTSDIVFEIIKALDIPFDEDIALCLYAGISSDTGCFMHPSTDARSHKHAYELIKYGFDLEQANYNMFKLKQKNYLFFYKTTLRNTKPYLCGQVYITFFNYKAYKRFEKICDNPASFQFLDGIEGNEIRVKIIEQEKDMLNLSFRSNKLANVCNIAQKFGGGGHIRAAGATVKEKSFKEIFPDILKACEEELSGSHKEC